MFRVIAGASIALGTVLILIGAFFVGIEFALIAAGVLLIIYAIDLLRGV